MTDVTTTAGDDDPEALVHAFGTARELLDHAAATAEAVRADAERYAHKRQLEADLLVQKARRLLFAAEEKAAVIVAAARAERGAISAEGHHLIDLDALASAPEPGAADGPEGIPPRLDDLLTSAISHAVSHALADQPGA